MIRTFGRVSSGVSRSALLSSKASLAPSSSKVLLSARNYASTPASLSSATFDLSGCFQTHNLPSGPNESVDATKDELEEMHKLMYTMRRMEVG